MVGISSYHLEDQNPYTPLEIAEKLGHVGIVEMLTNVAKKGHKAIFRWVEYEQKFM